jgi:glycosyltransferase involved in cell wall biosynthesis
VIAFPRGALPETVEHGRTGFLVESVEEMAAAMMRTGEISLADCRETALRRFSVDTMIDRYFEIYQRLASATQEERQSAGA